MQNPLVAKVAKQIAQVVAKTTNARAVEAVISPKYGTLQILTESTDAATKARIVTMVEATQHASHTATHDRPADAGTPGYDDGTPAYTRLVFKFNQD